MIIGTASLPCCFVWAGHSTAAGWYIPLGSARRNFGHHKPLWAPFQCVQRLDRSTNSASHTFRSRFFINSVLVSLYYFDTAFPPIALVSIYIETIWVDCFRVAVGEPVNRRSQPTPAGARQPSVSTVLTLS